MQFIKGQNIPLTLQLIKTDLTYEDSATITYEIYDNDLSTILVSTQPAIWNSTFNCYFDELDISVNWVNQLDGNFILRWNISDTIFFPEMMIEDVCIINDPSDVGDIADAVWDELHDSHNNPKSFGYLMNTVQNDVKRTLGLMHENIYIDLPNYDDDNNLIGARLRIYSAPDRVGTDIDVIGEYNITSIADGPGKFTTWQQIKNIY